MVTSLYTFMHMVSKDFAGNNKKMFPTEFSERLFGPYTEVKQQS
jgi:hypothetical protein